MAASRILLVLLSIALLALTSAQRVNEDDEASQEQDALEAEDSNQQHADIHSGLKKIKTHLQDQLNQHGKVDIKSKKGKNGQRGKRSPDDDDSLEVLDRQSGSQQGKGGQGGRGHSELKGQNGKGGQKGKKGKGGQKSQKSKGGQKSQKGKGGQKKKRGKGGQRNEQEDVQEVSQE
ncbi:oleosin-B4-like [Mastomys coucha]|uniref:oleosin-B4-like n=1 Tax=Mastomys coucha TaxID=35658 RepID=UPI0012617D2B|nr:oleosin-B4-like [Mastomys coucha]